MNIRTIGLPFTTVNSCVTSPTAAQFVPVTQWMSPASFQKIRATLELRARCGNIAVSVGYQVADVENNPTGDHPVESYSAPTTTGFRDQEGVHYPERWDTGIETQSVSSVLCRFGFLVENTSGTALSSARVAAKIEVFTA